MFVEQGFHTKADPFSLDSLIAWLEKQPADKPYDWGGDDCLLCQYLEARGFNKFDSYGRFDVDMRSEVALACGEKATFGAALQRARSFRDEYCTRLLSTIKRAEDEA